MHIGIDLMGGDNPPALLFPAILQAAKQLPSHQTLLVIATKSVVDQLSPIIISSLPTDACARISFQECEEVITMEDDPLTAVRKKKNSSLVVGMGLLKTKRIDALVSCGNTGALIASAALILPLLRDVSHPALLVTLPTAKGPVAVLDVGGNVINKSEQLVRFAFLGAAYQRAILGIKSPKVGLLNVGIESRKGTLEVRKAYEILAGYCKTAASEYIIPDFVFSGNIEARDLFKGTVDVLVTDGFTGNILLKTAEGVASFIFESLKDKIIGKSTPEVEKSFNDLKKQFNYAEYPGAIVCGVDGLVVKVHGNASAESLLVSIFSAMDCIQKKIISHIIGKSPF
ncbi:MAG TPA: phosphate acyltransferase PlsX [Parachlamydiaceae bacterium]|nr:phosphate acyltransferase PlsX [Parachlamydiaceae bacterium]